MTPLSGADLLERRVAAPTPPAPNISAAPSSSARSSPTARNKAMEGFDEVNDPRIARAVHQGGYADVLLRPTMVGILRCGKMLPPQLNLVIEIEFADATTALWSENAGAHPSGATLSTDFEIQNVRVLASQVVLDSALVESFNRVLLSGRSLVFSYPTVHTQQSSVPNGVAEHNVTVARAFTKLMGAFVTFWDNDAGSKIHLLANPGQDVAPIGAARQQEDSLLESQMQLGSLQYPHNPMKGASEHFHFLSVLAGTYDDTVRNIDIGRVGYLRHSFIAGFPTERVPKMPLSGVSTRSATLPGSPSRPGRHDDGPVHSFGGLPAGDALRNGCVRPGLKTAWHPTRRPGRNQACVRRANFFFVRIKKPDLPLRTMKLALGPVQSNAKGGRYVSLEDSEEIFYRRNCAVEILWEPGNFQDDGAKRLGICFTADPDLRDWVLSVEDTIVDNMIVQQGPLPGASRTELEAQL